MKPTKAERKVIVTMLRIAAATMTAHGDSRRHRTLLRMERSRTRNNKMRIFGWQAIARWHLSKLAEANRQRRVK